jgi:precorrin-2 dehydrogenase/sirohydrochlorin ferrochelatase
MKYYPVFLRLSGRKCLVVGGGAVAAQKVRALLAAGGDVTVLSPQLGEELEQLSLRGRVTHLEREYRGGDLVGAFIVFSATGDERVDRQVADDAATAGVLINVVDRPQHCDFISPSVVTRDDLIIAISTSGASPAMARQLREKLEAEIGPEYALALQLLGRLRRRLKDLETPAPERTRIFNELIDSPLLELLRLQRFGDVDELITHTAGAEFSLERLEIDWSTAS